MENKLNLIDSGFRNSTIENKRANLVLMDVALKRLHESGYMVTSFTPNNIYFQDGFYFFEEIEPISSIVADNEDEAILNNVIWMSVVALWAYSPFDNLMEPSYVSNNFNSFSFWYPEEDRAYYQSILVDSYPSGKIQAPVTYFSDYVIEQHKNRSAGSGNSLAYIKATEAGRAMANYDEAAFGHNFFLITVVASLTVILIGVILYFLVI